MISKKIAIIIWGLNISGGGTRQILELALSLQKQGHKVDIFCVEANKKNCYPHLLSQVNLYILDKKELNKTYILEKENFIQKCMHIHEHFLHKNSNLNALKKLIQKYDEKIHYDIFNYHETEVYKLARFFPTEKNFWMMNDLLIKGQSFLENLFRKFQHFEFILYYKKHIQKVIVLDNFNKKIIRTYLLTPSYVVRSGVDQKAFYFKKIYNKKNAYIILTVGIFFPHRRFEDIIESVRELIKLNIKNIELRIIGDINTDINYYTYILNLVKKYKLEKYVHIVGKVSETELKRQYQAADFFVFCHSPQTWGLSVIESMLSGCVALVSRGAGVHEVLKDRKTAILFNPGDTDTLANRLKELSSDEKLRKRIGIAGQMFVQNTFSWDRYAKDMMKTFLT